jgi:uncharacterized protein (TIGR03067 family)
MKRCVMRAIALLVMLILISAELAVAHAEDQGDDGRLQGSWTVSSGEKAGKKAPAEGLKDVTVTFTGGKFTWKAIDKQTEGLYSLDVTKTPREITMSANGDKLAGVYRLKGDELTICVGIGADRPTDFVTNPEAKAVLLVLKRVKP